MLSSRLAGSPPPAVSALQSLAETPRERTGRHARVFQALSTGSIPVARFAPRAGFRLADPATTSGRSTDRSTTARAERPAAALLGANGAESKPPFTTTDAGWEPGARRRYINAATTVHPAVGGTDFRGRTSAPPWRQPHTTRGVCLVRETFRCRCGRPRRVDRRSGPRERQRGRPSLCRRAAERRPPLPGVAVRSVAGILASTRYQEPGPGTRTRLAVKGSEPYT